METRSQRKVQVHSNYFTVEFKQPIFKYTISVESQEPLQPMHYQEVVKQHLFRNKENRTILVDALGEIFMFLNSVIYSTRVLTVPIELPAIIDDNPAKIIVVQDCIIFPDKDFDVYKTILGRFFKLLLKKLKLKQIGRKLFDPTKAQTMDMFDIWPGFSTSLCFNMTQFLLNVDMVSKIITNKNVLGIIDNIQQRFNHELENVLERELVGKSVMTTYNRRFYKIDKVVFDKNPSTRITLTDGSETTFAEYYLQKYEKKITHMNQPLLANIDPKNGNEIFLVPEFCVMTGLSEEQRSNRNLMTDLDKIIKPDAGNRLMKCKSLIDTIYQTDLPSKFLSEWQLNLSKDPLVIEGTKIDAGHLLFADRKMVDIENTQNLDRESQNGMFFSRQFKTIIIFYPRNATNEFRTFFDMSKMVFQQYKLSVDDVQSVEIPDFRNFDPIKQIAQSHLNPSVTACIWILPGNKKQGLFYDKIKRLLINNMPVPSQMMLAKTIAAGKNLRSIISKLYVQVMAKIGGIPWAINDLPFSDRPTMIVGLDCNIKPQAKSSIYSIVATTNNTFSTYWSASSFGSQDFNISLFLTSNITKALEKFQKDNKILPQTIIVFRDGVSKGQFEVVRSTEVVAIRDAFKSLYTDSNPKPSLVFVTTSKTSNAKFFYSPNGSNDYKTLQNPLQGTYLSERITDNPNEFYLLSQKTFRGLASPTNFYILENDMSDVHKLPISKVKDLVAKLAFKLCFLYYNTIGAIKVPAPIHYAQKLTYLIGDHSTPSEKIIPHQYLAQIASLYFI